MSEYQTQVEKIMNMVNEFKAEADQGESGRGSKGHSLKARKLSTQITNELKEYRRVSIANDKMPPPA